MNLLKSTILGCTVAAGIVFSAQAHDGGVGISVNLGFPVFAPTPVYVAPPVVYQQPQVVYQQPAYAVRPAYYPRPVVVEQYRYPVYGYRAFGGGEHVEWRGHDEWHGRDEWREHEGHRHHHGD